MARESDKTAEESRGDLEQAIPYRVGYRRPPQHTRFKRGQSGNPRGRHKGTRSLSSLLEKMFFERVTIREGDRARCLPIIEVVLRNILARASKGDPRATGALLHLMKFLSEDEPPKNEDSILLQPEYRRILADYLADSQLETSLEKQGKERDVK